MTTLGAAIGKQGRDAMRAAAVREVRTRYAPITFKAEPDEDGRLFFEGMANTVNPDRVNEVVNPKAFVKSVASFLKYNPQMFYNHDWSLSVGNFTEAKVTDQGLWVRGFVQPATDDKGEELNGELGEFIRFVRGQVKRKQIRTLSIGFRMLDSEPAKFTDPMTGKETKGREVTNLELLEVSLVTVPANRESAIEVRHAMEAVYGKDIAASMIPDDEAGEYLKGEMGEANESVIDTLLKLGLPREQVDDIVVAAMLKNYKPNASKEGATGADPDESEPSGQAGDDYEVVPLFNDSEYEVKSLFDEEGINDV